MDIKLERDVEENQIKRENVDCGTVDEANDLLKNGILVETSRGLVCMSLNDALSSDLNLSVEDLRNVAKQLILQQNVVPSKDRLVPQTGTCDSDGFSSECSDSTFAFTRSNIQPTYVKFTSLATDTHSSVLEDINRIKAIPVDLAIPSTSTDKSSEDSDSTRSNIKKCENSFISSQLPVVMKKKGRGGWPKGRKRKPELLNLPPKAPTTGYTLYLNEQRKFFKESSLPFYEITKIIGNRWSSLTLAEKKPYLEKAEEDKKRYREELRLYRQSDAYKVYLARKRRKRLQNNVMSESDMDATDDFDEEDNEELYCRTCDQWFHNFHNKREHLQAKKHLTTVAGDIHRQLVSDICQVSWDTPSVKPSQVIEPKQNLVKADCSSIVDAMQSLSTLVQQREAEIKTLTNRQQEYMEQQKALGQQLLLLNERHKKLEKDLLHLKEAEKDMELKVFNLWQVPSWFIISEISTDASTTDFTEGTE